MTDYAIQAGLAKDRDLLNRVAACAAGQGIEKPLEWAHSHQWEFAVRPGWCCSAPCGDSAGVTDDMIRDAVSDLTGEEIESPPKEEVHPEPEPEPDPVPEEPVDDPEDPAE